MTSYFHPQILRLLNLSQAPSLNQVLPQACPLCHQDLRHTLQGLACTLNWKHFNLRAGNLLFLRPISSIPFQVIINYRKQETQIGLWMGDRGPILTFPEILGWEELTEENLRIWSLLA